MPREHKPATGARWHRIGLMLVGATLAYNIIEGILAMWAGVQASSIALVGFGLDSFIECAAAGVVLWRLAIEARGARADIIERSERRVHRFIGDTFFTLALYVLLQAGWTLWQQKTVEESVLGIGLAVASLVIMPLVSWGKLRAATTLNSAALGSQGNARVLLSVFHPLAWPCCQRCSRLVVG